MTSEVETAAEAPVEVARDFDGREIKVGAMVAYAVRRGSSMWLNKRKVTGIEKRSPGGFQLTVFDPEAAAQRRTVVRNLSTLVVMSDPEDSE